MTKVDKFQEYALLIEDTARFFDHRQTVTNLYVAVKSCASTKTWSTFVWSNSAR